MNPKKAAEVYIDKGWYPVPLVPGTKECRDKDWMQRVYLPEEFEDNSNIGIRLVASSDDLRQIKLIGVDLDSPEAVASAKAILPESHASWGRASKKISQILYISEFERPIIFKDYCGEKKPTLLEIRVNHQSMAPPSLHPCGEELDWLDARIEAPKIEAAELLKKCRLLATSAMIARYYPPQGARHEWTLALTGTLRRLGLAEEDVILVMQASAEVAEDSKIKDRLTEVHSTFSKGEEARVTGSNTLAQHMPENGLKFVESLRRIWGSGSDFVSNEKSGKAIQSNPDNIRSALSKLGVSLARDEFASRIKYQNGAGWADFDDFSANRLWLEIHSKFGFLPAREVYDTVISVTADNARFNPVKDYLRGLKWDSVPRLERWLIDYAQAADSEYCKAVSRIVLIAAVRRIRRPGVKFDELLVLESPQGFNKSTALRALCPKEDWFTDDLPLGVDAKQIIERTSGKWIIEAAELVNMRRAQVEQLKASLSRQVDGPVRMAYGRYSHEEPRKFIIIGTTNSPAYLKDDTGNRRFWPVKIGIFDVERLRKDRDQLWAEAATREEAGESIRLPENLWGAAEKQQERRRKEDAWESILREAFDHFTGSKQRVSTKDIWKVLGIQNKDITEGSNERVHRVMATLGFRRITLRKGKVIIRGWGRDLIDGVFRPAGWE